MISAEYRPLDPWEEYPQIPLYMDQVLFIAENQLQMFRTEPDEHVLTASMVNNYVKKGLVAPPIKKKYGPEQVTRLVMIGILKQVLSIGEIDLLFRCLDQIAGSSQREIYEAVRKSFDRLHEELISGSQDESSNELIPGHPDLSQALRMALLSVLTRLEARAGIEGIGAGLHRPSHGKSNKEK